MIRFNCFGKPMLDDYMMDAVRRWAKAKGVNPEKVFKANNWNAPMKIIGLIDDEGFKISPGQEINTSVFEEAEVVEYIFNK
jgi:hypothetical protein